MPHHMLPLLVPRHDDCASPRAHGIDAWQLQGEKKTPVNVELSVLSSLCDAIHNLFNNKATEDFSTMASTQHSVIPTATTVVESTVIKAPLSHVWHHIKLQEFAGFWSALKSSEFVKGASEETDIVKWAFKDGAELEVKQEEHSVRFRRLCRRVAMAADMTPIDHQPLHHLLRHFLPACPVVHKRLGHHPSLARHQRRLGGQHFYRVDWKLQQRR